MTSSGPRFLIKDGALSWPEIGPMRERIYSPEKLASPSMHGIEWASAQRRLMLYVEDELCAAAGSYEREILHNDQPVRVAGIGGVMTEPKFQGKGHGAQTMLHLVELLRAEGNYAFGLLFCEDHNIGFYSKLGWSLFEGEVLVEQRGASGPFPFRNVMLIPLAGPAKLTGKLDLCGLPW
tara:strand:- start:1920 stop:2456 length:537 start_codon:yes stop_codon:yes gene_type:complete